MKKFVAIGVLAALATISLNGCMTPPVEEVENEVTPDVQIEEVKTAETADVEKIVSEDLSWKVLKSEDVPYSISYPSDWKTSAFTASSVMFAPPEMTMDFQWGVKAYLKSEKTTQEIITEIGSQFEPNRNELQEDITLNGINAKLVTVTTSEYPDWYSQTIIIENDEIIYTIGNGAIKDENFEKFYTSFELL